jgi:hypothetical protein
MQEVKKYQIKILSPKEKTPNIRFMSGGLLIGYEEIDLERAKTIPKHILKKWYREK